MSTSENIRDTYCRLHDLIMSVVERASDAQMTWRPAPAAHNLSYTLWHLARWADHLQSQLPEMNEVLRQRLGSRPQIWERDGLTRAWGFPQGPLGEEDSGMLLADELAAALPLPEKTVLADYARRVFQAADETISSLDDTLLALSNENNAGETVLGAVLVHIVHESRHLGEMEYLLGLQGQPGTATV